MLGLIEPTFFNADILSSTMFKPLEVFIGLRYTRAKRRNHFISFISLTSIMGVAVGVMALITVLSVMNGFKQELIARILGMTAHAVVVDRSGELRDFLLLAIEQKHLEVEPWS